MYRQTTNTLLMIEPVAFGYNLETASNNFFQHNDQLTAEKKQDLALAEFHDMVQLLRNHKINVITIKDTIAPHTPDSIFPNNWLSFHEKDLIAFFPMYAENRRTERRIDLISKINNEGFHFSEMNNYTSYEDEGSYLEGTGSMILDRSNRIAYASLSVRTDRDLFYEFCREFDFKPCAFNAYHTFNDQRLPIYHTNVMMAVAEQYTIICTSAIDNNEERQMVEQSLSKSGKTIITITEEQMHHFAGNMLQVRNNEGECFLVMSHSAYNSLTQEQKDLLKSFNEFIVAKVPTIEKYGGGSVRCMMAEIF